MEKTIITFSANEQKLQKTGGIDCYASNTVAYIEARFDLGENWSGYDSVRAVWWNDYNKTVATVLDSDESCIVPYEVLTRKGAVKVNLVGSIAENDVLTDRLTTCPVIALTIKCNAKTDGDNTQPITPSEYEQFVQTVKADADRAEAGAESAEASAQSASESATASANSATSSAESATASAGSAQSASESAQSAENAKDDAEDAMDKILGMRATAETLEAGSDATASYSDGLLTLGIPRGDRGEQGIQGETGATPNLTIGTVETLEPTEDATASITGTVENPVLNLGLPKGDTGEVSLADLEALLPTETASGSIVTITDGQGVVPAKSLKVQLEPIQEGSGTPSPDNVRPISGRTEVVTQRTGVNLFDEANATKYTRYFQDTGGNNHIWASDSGSGSYAFYCKPNTTYTVSCDNLAISIFRVGYIDVDPNELAYSDSPHISGVVKKSASGATTITTGANAKALVVQCNVAVVTAKDTKTQIELGSTATDYEPYNGITYTTTLGRTVYGGTLDVVSGTLTVTHGYIASYNGETLPSSWISDRDAYVSGTTPTVGAEVVYELAEPQTYQLTPQQVELLQGENNVWSDGDVTLVYSADIQRWVEKKLNGNSTTLTMSRPMVQTETTETEEAETETAETE